MVELKKKKIQHLIETGLRNYDTHKRWGDELEVGKFNLNICVAPFELEYFRCGSITVIPFLSWDKDIYCLISNYYL